MLHPSLYPRLKVSKSVCVLVVGETKWRPGVEHCLDQVMSQIDVYSATFNTARK